MKVHFHSKNIITNTFIYFYTSNVLNDFWLNFRGRGFYSLHERGGRGETQCFCAKAVTAALLFILKIIAIGIHTNARQVNPVSSSAPACHFYCLAVFSVSLTDGDLRYVYGNYPSSCFIYFYMLYYTFKFM